MLSRLSEDAEQLRISLYQAGASDREIATALNIRKNTFLCWRRSRGLSVNRGKDAFGVRSMLPPSETAIRLLLHSLGWGDKAIAKDRGVSRTAIRDWRRQRSLPTGGSADWHHRPTLNDVRTRVRRAIGRGLPGDIADDATSTLFLAVIDREVPLADVEKSARTYGNRAIEDIASRYGPRSLDEEIGDGEGFTLLDTLSDDAQSSWLEEMGATVW